MTPASPEYLSGLVKAQAKRISAQARHIAALETQCESLRNALQCVRDDEGGTLGEEWTEYLDDVLTTPLSFADTEEEP